MISADWVREYAVFAVHKGNPRRINGFRRRLWQRRRRAIGGLRPRRLRIKAQAEKCAAEGKPTLTVQSYPDQFDPRSPLEAGRCLFLPQAPLTNFVQQSNGELELAVGKSNGFNDLFQGAGGAEGLELGGVFFRDAIKVLVDNGTYAAIMKKWGAENNKIEAPASTSRRTGAMAGASGGNRPGGGDAARRR